MLNSFNYLQWQFNCPCVALVFECKHYTQFPIHSILLAYGTVLIQQKAACKGGLKKDFSDVCEDSSAPAVKTYFVDLKYIHGSRSSEFSSSMTGFLCAKYFSVLLILVNLFVYRVLNRTPPCPSVLLSSSSVGPLPCCQGNTTCYNSLTNGYPFTRLLIPNATLGS